MAVKKLWQRRNYAVRAIGDLAMHCLDTMGGKNKSDPNGKEIVIFVRSRSDIRIFKQAKALRDTGRFYTVFFTNIIDRKLMRQGFDEIHLLISIEQILDHVEKSGKRGKVLAIHTSSPPARVCRRLTELCDRWPVIFDQYDSRIVERGPDYAGDGVARMYDLCKQIDDEKFCYENADGVIAKTKEIEYVKSILNIKSPVLIYPDYAIRDWFMEPQPPIRRDDDRPHLVYAGGVMPEYLPDDIYGYAKFFDLAENLNSQRIHFHIYPSPTQTTTAEEYKRLDKKLAFFHFHRPVEPWKIQNEIAKYDFALNISWAEKSGHQKEKSETATGVKFGTYLEASLPIIVNKSLSSIAKNVEEEKIGFVIENDKAVIPEKMLRQKNTFTENVLRYREQFCAGRHIEELINFYENCAENMNKNRHNI